MYQFRNSKAQKRQWTPSCFSSSGTCEAQREGRDPRVGRGPTPFPGRARGQSSGLKSGGQGLPQEPQMSMWGPEGKGGRSDSERLTVIGHNRVPLVMFLSRPQMMLYALKLWG